MRKYFLILSLLFFSCFFLHAQMPQLTVDGKANNGVVLRSLKIDVKICGTIARTVWEMTFANTTSRILEGNLNFPLKDGLSISRYALDINGKMREAVPVDRSKGTEVFETIERRRVDPGLLEKVDGNTFRTRIYPINPNNTRTVLIGYEEELSLSGDAALHYYLPLNLKDTVAVFDLNVSVQQTAIAPVFDSSLNETIQFTSSSNQYIAGVHKINYTPAYALSFAIPKPADAPEVMLQEFENKYYFIANTRLQYAEKEKTLPRKIGLLWDASLSGAGRNVKKEMELLDAYFKKLSNVSVTVTVFSNTIKSTKTYSIQNGNWDELNKDLQAVTYDGATNFGHLNLKDINADEFILVSDGHQTLGGNSLQLVAKPVYCINSAAGADYSNLKFIAGKTGGSLIELQNESIANALKKLTTQQFRFLGIKENALVKEHYPSLPVEAGNSFAVAGIAEESIENITLQFGYGNTVVIENTIVINSEKQLCENFDITKIFAQKKIAELDIRYNDNKKEIERIGKQFGIVTRNTSLIVLETLNDYILYEIDPPAELRAEYNRFMKERNSLVNTKKRDELKRSLYMIDNLKDWYNKTTPKKEIEKNSVVRTQQQPVTASPNGISKLYTGKITDKDGNAIPFATIKIKGTNTGLSADAIGVYTIRAKESDVMQISAAGYNRVEVSPGNRTVIATVMERSGQALTEVVVTSGYGVKRNAKNITGSVQSVSTQELNRTTSIPVNEALQGKVAGVQVRGQAAYNFEGDKISSRSEPKTATYNGTFGVDDRKDIDRRPSEGIRVAADSVVVRTGTTDYLNAIKQTEKTKRYAKYLELRKQYGNLPTYFFETATYFLKTGDKENGLTILSNLAELENGSYELYKMLGYKLKEAGAYEEELSAFKKVMELRPADPQSYRDYALAYLDLGKYQQALDLLYEGLTKSYSPEMNRMYNGIEEIFLMEINNIIALHKKELDLKKIDKSIIAAMPSDIRVVMNWNKNNSDVDLWVTDPNEEKCFYSHKTTEMGGRISDDFTEGFGPEQFLLKAGEKGKYRIQVNYYADRQVTIAGPTTVMAEIYLHYGMPNQEKKIITLQMQKDKTGEVFIGEVEL